MRVIIAGGRDAPKEAVFAAMVQAFHDEFYPRMVLNEVVSGAARGADTYGEEWAKERGVPIKRFPAKWDEHGKKAGPLRNIEMGDYADALIAVWDGKSKGTQHMINYAKKKGLDVYVFNY